MYEVQGGSRAALVHNVIRPAPRAVCLSLLPWFRVHPNLLQRHRIVLLAVLQRQRHTPLRPPYVQYRMRNIKARRFGSAPRRQCRLGLMTVLVALPELSVGSRIEWPGSTGAPARTSPDWGPGHLLF